MNPPQSLIPGRAQFQPSLPSAAELGREPNLCRLYQLHFPPGGAPFILISTSNPSYSHENIKQNLLARGFLNVLLEKLLRKVFPKLTLEI